MRGNEYAEGRVEAVTREIQSVYAEAAAKAEEELRRHLERFEAKDEEFREAVEAGDMAEADWQAWRKRQMIQGRRWRELAQRMAEGYTSANQAAAQVINGELPAVAAENANYGAYQVDSAAGVDTSFSLQDDGTVQTLLSGSSAYLPEVSVAAAADIAWNRKGIQSAVTQGILLGESIPKIARRMQGVGAQNKAQAVRWARTYTTAAENAGRVASYERAQGMGFKLKQEWLATLDGRTRHSHRQLDGERREVGKKFSNGCRYPGDPQAAYAEICNCRCTLVAAVDGIDQDTADRFSRLPAGTTYEQWKAGKRAEAAAETLKASLTTKQAMSAKAVRAIVSKAVPLGAESGKTAADYIDLGNMSSRKAALFDEAIKYVPTKMLKTVKAAGVKAVRDMSLDRSEFDPNVNTLLIGQDADELTVVHELMHAVEEHDAKFLAAERLYFRGRTRGKSTEFLSTLMNDSGYGYKEIAYDVGDSCISPYAFKDYGGSGYELMSMGLETLYRSPSAYFNDLDMLRWVLSMLGRFSA